MKRIFGAISLILVLSVLLAACNSAAQQETPEDTATTAASTTPAATTPFVTTAASTEDPAVYDEDKELDKVADEFLSCIKNNDADGLCDLAGVQSKDAFAFFREITVDSYEILETGKRDIDYGKRYKVQFNTSKSSTELFPRGKSTWVLEVAFDESGPIAVFRLEDTQLNRVTWCEQNDVVKFCYRFSTELGCYKTLTDFNKLVPAVENAEAFGWFCDGLLRFLPSSKCGYTKIEELADRETLENMIEKVLGITNVNFKQSPHYNKEQDAIQLHFYGGHWKFCSLSSEKFDAQSKRHTVVLDFYADTALLVKAKTVKYLVQKNEDKSFTLVSTESLYDTGYEVAGGST